MASRLAPTITPDTAFFWDGLKEHKLLIQRCAACGVLRHPPRPMCPRCNSLDWNTVAASGRGELYSFVQPQHPPLPCKHIVLFDQPLGSSDRPVDVVFETFDDGLVLPLFRPAAEEASA